jgi:predicted nucleic acid-binding protein
LLKVFIDTSALYAIADKKDENHQESKTLYEKLLSKRVTFLITDYIIAECTTLIRRRLGYLKSVDFLDLIEESEALGLFEIVFVERAIFKKAKQILRDMKSEKLSLVDAISFAAMRHKKVFEYFAFDRHFDEAGFKNIKLEL